MDESKLPLHIKAALYKADEGFPLDETELMIVQWIRNGGGCSSQPVKRAG